LQNPVIKLYKKIFDYQIKLIIKINKMKKCLVLSFGIFFVTLGYSQKVITRSGEIKFEASMPAFEEISATNNTVSCVLDESNGDIASLLLIKAFKFKSSLMEEHFNENYLESTKFPKATFKGKIVNYDSDKLNSDKTSFDLEGELTIHGITKKIKTKIYLTKNAGKITLFTTFLIKPLDYNIEIPNLVKGKVAEKAKISIRYILEPL
jgi:polyisoprenoid-binding protein YceI